MKLYNYEIAKKKFNRNTQTNKIIEKKLNVSVEEEFSFGKNTFWKIFLSTFRPISKLI